MNVLNHFLNFLTYSAKIDDRFSNLATDAGVNLLEWSVPLFASIFDVSEKVIFDFLDIACILI